MYRRLNEKIDVFDCTAEVIGNWTASLRIASARTMAVAVPCAL
jgi:hypothetical protein